MRLDATNKTGEKVRALVAYFTAADPADAAWAVAFLTGRKPRTPVSGTKLRQWTAETAGVAAWLFEESYHAVGDLAETVALMLPRQGRAEPPSLAEVVRTRLLPLAGMEEATRKAAIVETLLDLDQVERFVFVKLLTGGWRVGVSQRLVTRALAEASGAAAEAVALRLMGDWTPDAAFYRALIAHEATDVDASRPYPFFLAHPLLVEGEAHALAEALGPREAWLVEWKWDGVRGQLVRRAGEVALWSRGEELVTDRFPEIAEAALTLPDGVVLDGEILVWGEVDPQKPERGVRPFADLQKRLGRKTVSKALRRSHPVRFLAYDVLEEGGRDIRSAPLAQRRTRLETLLRNASPEASPRESPAGVITLSPLVDAAAAPDWSSLAALRDASRARGVEGFMLKRLDSAYGVGRPRGDWWKWKVDPLAVDAVLLYAQPGHGRRAGLFTDYTFGVWDGDVLVPFAKAYSGLSDAEIREVDRFIRRHTTERFGPVRSVTPALVMEIAFENIRPSTRHKSGVAVRFPRIARWRRDKPPAEADTLTTVLALVPPSSETAA